MSVSQEPKPDAAGSGVVVTFTDVITNESAVTSVTGVVVSGSLPTGSNTISVSGAPNCTFSGRGWVSILLGVGDGTFQPAKSQNSGYFSGLAQDPPTSVAIGDFNADGYLDLAFTTGYVLILLGNGDGTFKSVDSTNNGAPGLVAIGDLGGGGRNDLAVSRVDGNVILTFLGLVPVVGNNKNWHITPATVPAGIVNAPYSLQLSVAGGYPPYGNWTISSGALPPGLSLAANSGAISGTPTTGGEYTFGVTVTDNTGSQSAPQQFTMDVTSPLPPVTGLTSSVNPSNAPKALH